MFRSTTAALFLTSIFTSSVAFADDPLLCSFNNNGGSTNPPSGRVAVTIHSLQLNDDMEIDVWPFDNRADVYGVIDIDADGGIETFNLPRIDGSDFPHWTQGNKLVSRPAIPGRLVKVVIHMREHDVQFSDIIDTSPDPAKDDLEFFIDTCSQRVSGDIFGSIGDLQPIRAGNAANQGTLMIEVKMDDGRPISNTANDIALTGFDLIQVVPNATRLVATKPTVAAMTVANNSPVSTVVSARVQIRRTGTTTDLYNRTEILGSFAPGEVRTVYFGQSAPFVPPSNRCGSFEIDTVATLILEPNLEPPSGRNCWTFNNSVSLVRTLVVEPKTPTVLWQQVGAIFDNGAVPTIGQVEEMRRLSLPLIRGIYPIGNMTDSISPVSFTSDVGPTFTFFQNVLSFLGLPVDGAYPFALLFELNTASSLSGFDRVLGVLPTDWFDNPMYGLWEDKTGVSFGEWMSRAVIFEAESSNSGGTEVGPRLALPGHELGHTFGLSLDPTIKGWPCSLTGNAGVIACGMSGGFDEYESDTHSDGVDTWGFWIPQGSVAPHVDITTGEQCNTHCLMGRTPINAQDDWAGRGRWIDGADYDQLITKLHQSCTGAATGVAFVSGLIDENDNAMLAWTFQRQGEAREPDFATLPGEIATPYGLKFTDKGGAVLGEAELPLSWTHPDAAAHLPVTIFGGFAAFPVGTQRIEVWNRMNDTRLADRWITPNRPAIPTASAVVRTQSGARVLEVNWTATDADNDPLVHFVQIAPQGSTTFWPVAHALNNPQATINLPSNMASGSYTARVLTSDGFNLTQRDVTFRL